VEPEPLIHPFGSVSLNFNEFTGAYTDKGRIYKMDNFAPRNRKPAYQFRNPVGSYFTKLRSFSSFII
jgi:hypothetical protein